MNSLSGFGRKASTGIFDNEFFFFFLILALAGFVGGLFGCHLFGNPEKNKCHEYNKFGIWISFILALLVLGITGKKTFMKPGGNSFGF